MSVLKGATRTGTVPVGSCPSGVAVDPGTHAVFVANSGSNTVSVIEESQGKDYNSDGRVDLLARDSSGSLWLYPGNGAGGCLPRVRVGGGWNVMTALVS